MNITEQATQVLAEIDAALAICEKATAGPWDWAVEGNVLRPYADLISPTRTILAPRHDGNFGSELRSLPQDRNFIAHSRTVCPKSLEIIRDDINAWLAITDTNCDNDGMICRNVEIAEKRLTALIAQWNSNK